MRDVVFIIERSEFELCGNGDAKAGNGGAAMPKLRPVEWEFKSVMLDFQYPSGRGILYTEDPVSSYPRPTTLFLAPKHDTGKFDSPCPN